jgi:hypothetical protein
MPVPFHPPPNSPDCAPPPAAAQPAGAVGLSARLQREPVQIALLVAFTLLVHLAGAARLDHSGDEFGAVAIARHSLGHIITHFHSAQNHPLFSIQAHLALRWLPLPDLYAIRIPALLAGVLTPLVFYLTHRRWCGRPAALAVAFVLVLADPLHYYASAGRGYAPMVLGVLLMNHCLLSYLARPRARYLLLYALVGVAAAYTHLWALIVMPGHAAFVALAGLARRRSPARSAAPLAPIVAAMAVTLLATFLAYLPMLDEVRSMALHGRVRGLYFAGTLVDSVLQLARFRDWTLAAYLFLVPILLHGVSRKLRATAPDRVVLFHVTVIVCGLAAAWWEAPWNFFTRFLMGLIPSGAALAAWALSGQWARVPEPARPALPRPVTWLAALAVGTLVANASITMDIPEVPAHTDDSGRDHNYFHRDLAKALAALPLQPAGLFVVVGLATSAVALRRPVSRPRWSGTAEAYFWTAALAASLPSLILGPHYHHSRWLYELHLLAVAAVWLFAWEHRGDPELLRRLRWGLLLTVLAVAFWQLDRGRTSPDATTALRLAAMVPIALAAAALACHGTGRNTAFRNTCTMENPA